MPPFDAKIQEPFMGDFERLGDIPLSAIKNTLSTTPLTICLNSLSCMRTVALLFSRQGRPGSDWMLEALWTDPLMIFPLLVVPTHAIELKL